MKKDKIFTMILLYLFIIVGTPLAFLIICIPSNIYGYSLFLLLPVGSLIRVIIGGKFNIASAVTTTVRLRTPFVLFVLPAIMYIFVSHVLAYLLFLLMIIYLIHRLYSGAHQATRLWFDQWGDLEKIITGNLDYTVKYNIPLTLIIIALNILAIFLGSYLGGTIGIWIGIGVFIIAWVLAPHARGIIIKEPNDNKESANNVE